jgi:hypothetical protein
MNLDPIPAGWREHLLRQIQWACIARQYLHRDPHRHLAVAEGMGEPCPKPS